MDEVATMAKTTQPGTDSQLETDIQIEAYVQEQTGE